MSISKTKKNGKKRFKEFARKLEEKGYEDILILDKEHAKRITPKRQELINVIKKEEIKSIRNLARKVDRDPNNVLDDIKILFELDVINVEKKGRRKIPKMAHKSIALLEEIV